MIFHIANNIMISLEKWSNSAQVKPILFLFRLLTSAEGNYWSIELELAGLVWVIKKIRHLLDSSKHNTVIQTDHSAILNLLKQKFIVSTTSTMRMNVRLVRASQFLYQFNLDVRYKSNKEHVVPDALFRLASLNRPMNKDHSELNVLFTMTLVEMSTDFHDKLMSGY